MVLSAALNPSRALARVRQNPLEAGMMGKSGMATTPPGRPEEEDALREMEAQSSNLRERKRLYYAP